MLGVQSLNKLGIILDRLPVFYSGLAVQTLNKLDIILDGKQSNNHRLNCIANANTSKNCHNLQSLSVNIAL